MARTRRRRPGAVDRSGAGAPRGLEYRACASRPGLGRLIIRTISRLLFAAYFFEAGLILTLAPWSVFWDRNGFTNGRPGIEAFVESPYVRGAATGIGIITMLAGVGELGSVLAARWRGGQTAGSADDTTRA